MMKCLQTNNQCPCCRTVLQEKPETETDDEEDIEYTDDEEEDDEDEEDEDEEDEEEEVDDKYMTEDGFDYAVKTLKDRGFTYKELLKLIFSYKHDGFVQRKKDLNNILWMIDCEMYYQYKEQNEMMTHDKPVIIQESAETAEEEEPLTYAEVFQKNMK